MCRLLLIDDPAGFEPAPYLDSFKSLCRDSHEFQGHGWGCAWLDHDGGWRQHHQINPIWQHQQPVIPATTLLLVHARSAFRDEGIRIENNMPFSDGETMFIFNGELQGVRIKAEGRIGAEKIYNYVRRFNQGDMHQAVTKATGIIERRTRYVRAMNFFIAAPDAIEVCSWFGEDPDYFQLHHATAGQTRLVCSAPLPALPLRWDTIPNRTIKTLRRS